ncbi:hypothetical protein NEOLI_000146 [Neolecta irregularis DAH-3]|uniref:Uncharacterized protein n=1 Tax=Neolecta irregularis (strain DAH-3) TaxID=1198029 RepID=A0A1U7LQU0_NEOID|nr:hypothetical protein NEOLI_000146 [Neolecta irregularis DAH-3]|eukprot:OLL25040.1 hypothetical protein NEOLI_000146 [Neolecta irregularis DAH-3]
MSSGSSSRRIQPARVKSTIVSSQALYTRPHRQPVSQAASPPRTPENRILANLPSTVTVRRSAEKKRAANTDPFDAVKLQAAARPEPPKSTLSRTFTVNSRSSNPPASVGGGNFFYANELKSMPPVSPTKSTVSFTETRFSQSPDDVRPETSMTTGSQSDIGRRSRKHSISSSLVSNGKPSVEFSPSGESILSAIPFPSSPDDGFIKVTSSPFISDVDSIVSYVNRNKVRSNSDLLPTASPTFSESIPQDALHGIQSESTSTQILLTPGTLEGNVARTNQISNTSLLAINRQLEKRSQKQAAEIRLLREKLTQPSGDVLDLELPDLKLSTSDENTEEEPETPCLEKGDVAKPRIILQRSKSHHEALLDAAASIDLILNRSINLSEHLLREARKAVERVSRISDVHLGGRVLGDIEWEDSEENTIDFYDQEEHDARLTELINDLQIGDGQAGHLDNLVRDLSLAERGILS